MKHAREDYNRIQDPAELIPADEPVFLLRGCDVVAPETLRYYAKINKETGGSPEIIRLTKEQAIAMDEWQKEHGAKFADLPASYPQPKAVIE